QRGLFCCLGHHGILGIHDLPAARAPYPRVGPYELAAPSAFFRPCLTPLSHLSVAEEANMHVIGLVAEEWAGTVCSSFDRGLLVEQLTVQHPNEIVRKDTLHDRCIIGCD